MTALVLERPFQQDRRDSTSAGEFATSLPGRLADFRERLTSSALTERHRDTPLVELIFGFLESKQLSVQGDFVSPSTEALNQTIELVRSLPSWAPQAQPIFEHDGVIALEWDVGSGHFLLVALDGTGYIEYSSVLGLGEEHSGRVPFRGGLPDEALSFLARLAHQ